jgi:hypothetical protein
LFKGNGRRGGLYIVQRIKYDMRIQRKKKEVRIGFCAYFSTKIKGRDFMTQLSTMYIPMPLSVQNILLPGYYADPSPPSQCQIFHVCVSLFPHPMFSFLCPNGTVFNQEYFSCDWWFNVNCKQAESLYVKNKEVKEEQDRLASASPSPKNIKSAPQTPEKKVETIFPAIEKANEKYAAPGDDGSGDKDPVDPGVRNQMDTVEALSTGYLPPQRELSQVSEYKPTKENKKRYMKRRKSKNKKKGKKAFR